LTSVIQRKIAEHRAESDKISKETWAEVKGLAMRTGENGGMEKFLTCNTLIGSIKAGRSARLEF